MQPLDMFLVLPAAGAGSRMQADRPKQYLSLAGKTILQHTLERMLAYEHANFGSFKKVVLVVSDGDEYWADLTSQYQHEYRLLVAYGGQERSDSVFNGLHCIQQYLASEEHEGAIFSPWVAVHDVARPCVDYSDLDALFDTCVKQAACYSAKQSDGALLANPVRDTMKRASQPSSEEHVPVIDHTVERADLWHALTPQVFPLEPLLQALTQCEEKGIAITDEASAIEACAGHPQLVSGRPDNIKITHPDDLMLAELFMQRLMSADATTHNG